MRSALSSDLIGEETDGMARSQGAELVDGGVRYRTWIKHPQAEVVIVDEDDQIKRVVTLEPDGDGYFSGIDAEGKAGELYRYRFGGPAFPDPAARFQPHGVHGPSQVQDPSSFEWKHDASERPP